MKAPKQFIRRLFSRLLHSRLLTRLLRRLGYDLEKVTLAGALERTSHRVHIESVIDIGASDGRWTQECLRYFPQAHFLLIEAQEVHEAALKRFCEVNKNADYVLTAAGDREGQINFEGSHPMGGLASESAFARNNVVVPVATVDSLVAEMALAPPYLLKLDTHGFEVPIFSGAAATLKKTQLIVVEVYNFHVAENSLHFAEMVTFLDGLGFRPADLCDPLHRPLDRALWQFDLFFERKDSQTFDSDNYLGDDHLR